MPARKPYFIQDTDGDDLGILLSLRANWEPGDTFVFKGEELRVVAVVPDEHEGSGWVARLTVEPVV